MMSGVSCETVIKAQSDEENRLKIAEKEKVISDLKVKLDEAQRKADQGSQQAQGEVLNWISSTAFA